MKTEKRMTDKKLELLVQILRISGIIFGISFIVYNIIIFTFYTEVYVIWSTTNLFILFSMIVLLFFISYIIIGLRKILKELSSIKKSIKEKK